MTRFTCLRCGHQNPSTRLVEHGTDHIPLCKGCFKAVERKLRAEIEQ